MMAGMRLSRILMLVAALPLAGAQAAVSEKEAATLKSDLTPVGAQRAGNADGTIPAWTGGYRNPPQGYVEGALRPDPFSAEKPDFSITAANYRQYAGKLPDGAAALFEKYPD